MEGREKACIDKYDDLDVKKTTKTRKEKRKAHTHKEMQQQAIN